MSHDVHYGPEVTQGYAPDSPLASDRRGAMPSRRR